MAKIALSVRKVKTMQQFTSPDRLRMTVMRISK